MLTFPFSTRLHPLQNHYQLPSLLWSEHQLCFMVSLDPSSKTHPSFLSTDLPSFSPSLSHYSVTEDITGLSLCMEPTITSPSSVLGLRRSLVEVLKSLTVSMYKAFEQASRLLKAESTLWSQRTKIWLLLLCSLLLITLFLQSLTSQPTVSISSPIYGRTLEVTTTLSTFLETPMSS